MDMNQIYTSYMYSYPHKTAYGPVEADPQIIRGVLKGPVNLYVHLPFCRMKCGYCNLFSVTGRDQDYFRDYLRAVRMEGERHGIFSGKINWESFTIGGGTPLMLPPELLEELFALGAKCGALDSYSSIETSPGETSKEKVRILKEASIRRVSIGVQSFVEHELRELGRRQPPALANKALTLLKEAAFECLNLDLIYGLLSQTRESLRYSLKQAMEYRPEEIFIYPLYIRQGTRIYKRSYVRNKETYHFYWFIREYLLEQGYQQISMRRFIRRRQTALLSCGQEATLSLGCGGRSYLGNLHLCTPFTLEEQKRLAYIDEFIKGAGAKPGFGYCLNQDEQRRRYLIKNLLHIEGVSRSEYRQLFLTEAEADFPLIDKLVTNNYCIIEGDRICLTPLGLSLSDYIGPMFISEEVKERMAAWKP